MGDVGACLRGGLSAAELATETLFPGDTIEYFSMAFVAGDPRGHRVAKVMRVERSDVDFPIRVETQEMLPLTMMLKRKRDRLGREVPSSDAKWRKLRTFRLVDGEVEGETNAQRLNAGLKKVVGDAFAAVRKQLVADKAQAKSRQVMQSFLKPATLKEKENEGKSSDSGDSDASGVSDDDFEVSPVSKTKVRATNRKATPQSVKHLPLGSTDDSELNSRGRGSGGDRSVERMGMASKAKEQKWRQQRREERRSVRPQVKVASSPSLRQDRHRDLEGSRPVKRRRLDFKSDQSSERLLGDTTAADEDDSGDATRSVRRPYPSQHHSTPEKLKKKSRKVQIQKFVDQIQEKKADADINEYIALDKKEQEAKRLLEKELAARPTKTLQLNRKAADAHKWQDKRKKFRDGQAGSDITSWLSRQSSKAEAVSPSRKRRDREARRAREDEREETVLEAMLSEVFDESGSKGGRSDRGQPEKLGRSVKVERSKYWKSDRKAAVADVELMNKWIKRKR